MRKVLILCLLLSSITLSAQKIHTVKAGETMESIAQVYGVSVQSLKQQNPNVDMLFTGIVLNLPAVSQKQDNQAPTSNSPKNVDRIEMKDGSYIPCKVVSIKGTVATIEQEDIEGTTTIPTKDINLIVYADGKKRKFK